MSADLATVTAKGQVTIPKVVRDAIGVVQGDQLLFVPEGDHILVIPLRRRTIDQLFGSLPATRPYPGLDAVREETRLALGRRMAGERGRDPDEGDQP